MQIVKIDAMKKSVTKMTIALLHILTYLKTNKCQKNLLALYVHILCMSDSKRNGQLGFIQNILQQRVIYPFGY